MVLLYKQIQGLMHLAKNHKFLRTTGVRVIQIFRYIAIHGCVLKIKLTDFKTFALGFSRQTNDFSKLIYRHFDAAIPLSST